MTGETVALLLTVGGCAVLGGFCAYSRTRMRGRFEERSRALREDFEQKLMDRTSQLIEANSRELEAFADSVASLERRLTERTLQLEAANRELEAFAYSVSHDLRAPLERIEGFSDALLVDCGESLGAQGLDYLRRIGEASRRMGQLIDALLKLSRLTRGELRRVPVDLTRIATEVTEELRRGEPGRDVSVTIAPGLVTEGDAEMLRVVLENLLGNAWKFTGKRAGARIEFGLLDPAAAEGIGRAGERVHFVRDNGAGFDMAYAGKLFTAFQRLHSADDFPGTGIGLATVSRVIHRHGGQVWAEGAAGEGACFYFTLGNGETAPKA